MVVAARRKREKEARREAILDAAARTLERLGLAMKMADVAAEAEVSKGTLYLYFASKDALLAGFAQRNIAALVPRIRSGVEQADSGLEAALAVVRGYFDFFIAHPFVFGFMVDWLREPNVDGTSNDFQQYRARLGELQQMLLSAFERGKADGSIRLDIDSVHQAMHVWSSSVGVMLMHHNAKAMSMRMTIPVDFTRLVPLHLDAVRQLLQVPSQDGTNDAMKVPQ